MIFNIKLTKQVQSGELLDKYQPLRNYIETDKVQNLTVNNLFNFDMERPIDIECQSSYDGSVNLILNDGKNIPRLINTRFTCKGKYQYEIIDRSGTNDTNIYSKNSFQSDTSLFKIFKTYAKISLKNITQGGNLKVGNYVFYFKYADADGNETNIAAQSGLCPCYCGTGSKINGAYADYNSGKQISLQLTNLDTTFDYIYLYYSRYSSDQFELTSTKCAKLIDKYSITKSDLEITITGNENITDITVEELNQSNEILNSCYTQAQSHNTLFLANVQRHVIEYENLKDLSLRIYPTFESFEENIIQNNPTDIHDNVGYFANEFYRFGIVYIYNNNTESPVFNIRGILNDREEIKTEDILLEQNERNYLLLDNNNNIKDTNHNASGVSYTPYSSKSLKLKIHFPKSIDFKKELLRQGITGYYIVRQKRIPTILTQMYTLNVARNNGIPLLYNGRNYQYFNFNNESLTQCDEINQSFLCGICPDYTVRQPYYNQLFNGEKFYIKAVKNCKVNVKDNLYTIESSSNNRDDYTEAKLQFVKDDVPTVKLESFNFHSRCGTAEELNKFEILNEKKSDWRLGNPVIRGIFGPYVAIYINDGSRALFLNKIINVYVPGFKPLDRVITKITPEIQEIINIRSSDNSPFSAIGDRIEITVNDEYLKDNNSYARGDCYNCIFTQRFIRNFQDPTAPNNDVKVKEEKYSDLKNTSNKSGSNFKYSEINWNSINRGDVNAVQLGYWITVPVQSVNNLNIRSVDDTYPSEIALTGNTRAFYPYREIDLSGNNKIPESFFINEGFSQSLGVLKKFVYVSVPYLKNIFTNRIYYSNISVNDGYQNGYRIIKGTHYRDYTTEYGQITKIVEFNGFLVIVFEHGLAAAQIGPRTQDQYEYLNTTNILPENPVIISSQYGSIYADSVVVTPNNMYGVDTVAKKIWKFNGSNLDIISELKVESFLNKNITFKELDTDPILAIKNCKSIYNSQKQDVLFTFYNYDGVRETAWNLCYNELIQQFITFYSWIPLFGCNIDKNFLTFDRDINRNLISFAYNNQKQNILLDNYIINPNLSGWSSKISFISEYKDETIKKDELTGYTYIKVKDSTFGTSNISVKGDTLYINISSLTDPLAITLKRSLKQLGYITIQLEIVTSLDRTLYPVVTLNVPERQYTNYLYKHGINKIFNYQDKILPTFWYGKQHPFEFEFIISKDLHVHKLFNKFTIISNNAEPESFHYQITGDCFDFAEDKEQMYFRQEITRSLFNNLGSNIKWDEDIKEDESLQNGIKLWNISRDPDYLYNNYFAKKSTILPCIYNSKVSYINQIEDEYIQMFSPSKNYSNLAGAEIVKENDEYYIANHAKAVDMKYNGRLRGNMYYQEDRWFVQINPINLVQKNELKDKWVNIDNRYLPPIVVLNNPLPNDIIKTNISDKDIPTFLKEQYGYSINNIDGSNWNNARQECKVKDKYIKIKIRYDGTKQSNIYGIITYYTEVN